MVVLTDLSEVLIKGMYGLERYIIRQFGGGDEAREIAECCLAHYIKLNDSFRDLMRGKICEKKYWSEFFKDGDLPFDVSMIRRALSYNFAHEIPGTLNVYRRITAAPINFSLDNPGYEIPTFYIVSDHVAEWVDEIKALHPHIFQFAKETIWSFEMGQIKSDPGFFEKLLEEHGLQPNEALLVDDYDANIKAAKTAGIEAIRFEDSHQLAIDLLRHGFSLRSQ